MAGPGREDGGGGSLVGATADEAGVGAAADGQSQSVEDDRLADAGLTGEGRQAGPERQVEPFDEDNVASAEADQHGPRVAQNRV